MKKIIILVIGIMLLLGSITAFASAPNTYSFTVTNDKLVYQVGDSIELVFKHGSLSNRYDQIDFSAQIYVDYTEKNTMPKNIVFMLKNKHFPLCFSS